MPNNPSKHHRAYKRNYEPSECKNDAKCLYSFAEAVLRSQVPEASQTFSKSLAYLIVMNQLNH